MRVIKALRGAALQARLALMKRPASLFARWIADLIAERHVVAGPSPAREASHNPPLEIALTGRAFFAMPIPMRSDGGPVFDAIEIAPVVEFDADGSCEAFDSLDEIPADLRHATFWSVYGHVTGEGLHCIGDFESSEAAFEVLKRLFGDLKPLRNGTFEF